MKRAWLLAVLILAAASPPAQKEAPAQGEAKDASAIRNFFRVNEQICTGGQPTAEELALLKAQGVRAIVNLRQPSEYDAAAEAARAKELGLRYFHIPVNSAEPKDEQVGEFLKVLSDERNRPAFIHCGSANRVGAFWMVRRIMVDRHSAEDAEEEAKRIGLRSPRLKEFALDYVKRHAKK